MSSIKSEFEELNAINTDIKRQLDVLKKLRNKKKELEISIADYLNQKDLPGVKYNGDVILLEKRKKTVTRGKKAVEQSLIGLLRDSGVANAEELAAKIQTAGKESIETQRIKITKT
jgi:hypothetical protein